MALFGIPGTLYNANIQIYNLILGRNKKDLIVLIGVDKECIKSTRLT